MKTIFIILALILGFSPNVWAAVQTDTHTYIVSKFDNAVLAINRQTGEETKILVGQYPLLMVIHGEKGYVVNRDSNNVSVLDLSTNEVTQTIPVGRNPESMVIHGDKGYITNWVSHTVSVLDLSTNEVIQTIPVGIGPRPMEIHGGMGYVVNWGSANVSVIDLRTNSVVTTFKNPGNKTIDFSDTHVYLGLNKYGPHYPTLASINRAKEQNTLGEFVAMMPEVFQLGEIEKRSFPKEENGFDILEFYTLAQEIFWDLKTGEPLMDPKDILATLITMKYPQRFLKTEAGAWLRKRLHMAFFQTVWSGDKDKAQAMLTYFVQLQDPVITKLATYTFKGAKKSSDQKATNSTDLD